MRQTHSVLSRALSALQLSAESEQDAEDLRRAFAERGQHAPDASQVTADLQRPAQELARRRRAAILMVAIAVVAVWLLRNLCVGMIGAFLLMPLGETVKHWLLYGEPNTNEWEGSRGLSLPWIWLILGNALTVLASVLVSRAVARTQGLPRGIAVACGLIVSLAVPLLVTFNVARLLHL